MAASGTLLARPFVGLQGTPPAFTMSGNPFDPFGSSGPAPPTTQAPPSQQYGAPPTQGMHMPTQSAPGFGAPPQGMNSSASGAPGLGSNTPQPQQQQYGQYFGMQQPMQQNQPSAPGQNFGQQPPAVPGYGQQQPQQQQQSPYGQQAHPSQGAPAPPAPAGYSNPFGSAPPQPAQNQMVISNQPSNPYALGGSQPGPPAPTSNYSQQALVPAQQPPSQWGVPGPAPGASGFDPFAVAPAPPPPPPPAPAPTHSAPSHNPFGDDSLIPGVPGELVPAEPTRTEVAPPPSPPRQQEDRMTRSQQQPPYGQGQPQSSSREMVKREEPAPAPAPPAGQLARNPYSQEISRRAAHGGSPLPKAELVKKSGYVLSRISFRTIVMKKWKQAYWVQYGSHTMLWFRNQHDFDDWLNNPYHSQAQRNFLIKLAINFVHDLYKPNVRGYQVTQSRSKPYGNKMVRQFKLERWMDYGPTIAAAFGSYDPKEVDSLREAIVECMRNTPLDGGIRATGAVRQMPSNNSYSNRSDSRSGSPPPNRDQDRKKFSSSASAMTYPQQRSEINEQPPRGGGATSVVSATDLLDDMNNNGFDDTQSLPGAVSSSALVPSFNQHQAYPGAPPPPQNYGQPPQQQQQQGQGMLFQQPPPPQAHASYHQPPPAQQFHQPPPSQYQQPPPPSQYQQQPPPPQQQTPPPQYQQQTPAQQYQQPFGYGQQFPNQSFSQ